MSRNWIKMRTSLIDDGRVREVKRKCNASRVTVCGALYVIWSLADLYADENGVLQGYTSKDLNEEVEIENFCESLPSDWIDLSEKYVKLPNYVDHNGSTSKKRSETLKRVQKHRKVKRKCNAESVTDSILFLSNNNKDRDRGVGKEKEAPSPIWPDCEHLRMSEAESKTVLNHYQKNNYPVELLPKAAQVLDDWLGSTGKEAIKARKQPTHYRRMWADWVLESAQKLHKVANPQAGGKLTNAQKAKEISNKIRSMNENGRSGNSVFDGVSHGLLASNGSDRGTLPSVSRKLSGTRFGNDEKSNSVAVQKLTAQLPAFDPRNSSGVKGNQRAKSAEIVQGVAARIGADQRTEAKPDSGIKNEISAAMEALRK